MEVNIQEAKSSTQGTNATTQVEDSHVHHQMDWIITLPKPLISSSFKPFKPS